MSKNWPDEPASYPPPPSPPEGHDVLQDVDEFYHPATPSSPEPRSTTVDSRFTGGAGYYASCEVEPERPASPPAELTEAVSKFDTAARCYDFADPEYLAAHTALVSLYTRQREEIEEVRAINRGAAKIHLDQFQELERLKAEQGTANTSYASASAAQPGWAIEQKAIIGRLAHILLGTEDGLPIEWDKLVSAVERLKADSLTAEEAQHALHQIPDAQCAGFDPLDCPVCYSIREKLARLSSDSGTGGDQPK